MAGIQLDLNGIFVSDLNQSISYPDTGNQQCFAIEANSFWFKHRNNIIKEIIKKSPFNGNFADIGGGNGFQANFIRQNFPEHEVFLIEPGYQGCLNAKKYGVENVYNMLFQDFDFQANNIGGIGLFDVVEHIEDDVLFFKELSGSAVRGTKIYMTVPAYNLLWSDVDTYSGHFRRYNSLMVRKLAEKANLKLLYNGYFMSYLPIPIFFTRALAYKLRGAADDSSLQEREKDRHNTGKIIGATINTLNNLELSLIRSMGKLIFGGSCICVFQTQ